MCLTTQGHRPFLRTWDLLSIDYPYVACASGNRILGASCIGNTLQCSAKQNGQASRLSASASAVIWQEGRLFWQAGSCKGAACARRKCNSKPGDMSPVGFAFPLTAQSQKSFSAAGRLFPPSRRLLQTCLGRVAGWNYQLQENFWSVPDMPRPSPALPSLHSKLLVALRLELNSAAFHACIRGLTGARAFFAERRLCRSEPFACIYRL